MVIIGQHIQCPKYCSNLPNQLKMDTFAFFLGSPTKWSPSIWNERAISMFQSMIQHSKLIQLSCVVVHGCYLLNPASTRPDVVEKTYKKFKEELQLCEQLDISYYVFHPGCSKDTQHGLDCLIQLINFGLKHTNKVKIVIENMTKTNTLCQSWKDIRYVLDNIQGDKKRVGVCMDTAHCWGAGHKRDMYFDTLLDDFEKIIGIDKLFVIHLNDSKIELGQNRDRHEDILKGKIKKSFWYPFLTDPRIQSVPMILETPNPCCDVVRDIITKKIIPKNKIDQTIINTLQFIESVDLVEEVNKESKKSLYDYCKTNNDWNIYLEQESKQDYFKKLSHVIKNETRTIFPSISDIFSIFYKTPLSNIKVVILGQDPYRTPNMAHGLAFSVSNLSKIPPSLRNIFKELKQSIPEYKMPLHGNLSHWSQQGVFLLNRILTVCEKKPLSHKKIGWERFTDKVLNIINQQCRFVVFMLWGNLARQKKKMIDMTKHVILESTHPSPFSAHKGSESFIGSSHFKICNHELEKRNYKIINW